MAHVVLNLVATSSTRVNSLPVKDGQLIFVQDVGKIAFDFKGKRVFYNQITELETESERYTLEEPSNGYYFVIGTGCLWFYKNGWTQITGLPADILFIGVELPELGQENRIYVNKTEKDISVWDNETNQYIKVANYTTDATEEDIRSLFN